MSIIKIENVSFGYVNKEHILKNINLDIEKEKFTCIIGENGSGKSTLIRCILGLNTGYEGKIERPRDIGYLPQRMNIQSDFPASVKEVILSGTISKHIRSIFYTKVDKQKVKDVMEKLEISELANKAFSELSGGQVQRVLLGRALCSTNELLILDEPTNGLDPKIAKQIYELLNKINKEEKITILMISHDTERALKYAHNVVEVKQGKIEFSGSVEKYLNGGDK